MGGHRRSALVAATAVVLAAFGAVGPAQAERSTAATGDPIQIGYIGDLTGPNTGSEVPYLNGIRLAVETVNANGGVNGRPIELLVEDSRFDVATATAAYQKLIANDDMVGMMGFNGSSVIAALAPEVDRVGIPVVGPAATTAEGLASPNFYNLQATLEDQGQALAQYIAENYPEPAVATAVINVASGTEWEAVMDEAIPANGGTNVAFEKLEPGAVEATSQVSEIERSGATVVTIHSNVPLAVVLLKEMQAQGLELPVFGSYGAAGETLWKSAGDFDTSQIFGVNGWAMHYADVEGGPALEAAIEEYGLSAEDLGSTPGFTQGYVAGLILAEALGEAGDNPTRESLSAALQRPEGYDTYGFAGHLDWSTAPRYGVREVRIFGWDADAQQIVALSDAITAG